MKKISFVVPAFNEESNIENLYQRIISIMNNYQSIWELIFINDGSIDNTDLIIKNIASNDKRVKYLSLSRNFGHQQALTAGLAHASGDAIVSMDCDLQDPPEVVDEMIQKWQSGYEIVYARRLNFRKDNFIKKIASYLFYRTIDNLSSIKIPRNVGDFRLIDKKVLRELNRMPEKSRYLRGMVAWTGFKSTFVDYYRPDRLDGASGYTFKKLFNLAMNGLLNFSFLPLRFALVLGMLSIFLGMVLLFIQLYDFFINNAYYHLYKWLVVILFIFMGFLFMLIWIIGEYIAKIFDEVRQRPVYIVDTKINFNENQD